MKAGELIKYLQNFNPDAELIMQADSEGNSYSPLAGADKGIYVADTTWSGTFYDTSWTADDCDMDDEEFAELQNRPLAIVLYPVN
jgi:hypothetical protein